MTDPPQAREKRQAGEHKRHDPVRQMPHDVEIWLLERSQSSVLVEDLASVVCVTFGAWILWSA